MLWYKSWLDTRWRFLIGLALLSCSAAASVLTYPQVIKLLPMAPTIDAGGEIGRRIMESVQLARTYRGYVWSHWFRQEALQLGTLFAVLLGTGGLLSHHSRAGTLFTLSLPVSRDRLLAIRSAAGLAQLFVLALVPALLIPLLSPAVGESFGIGSGLAHGACAFVGWTAFFSLALLLSTVFGDLWRPLLLALSIAAFLGIVEQVFRNPPGIFRVMSGEEFFRTGHLPWLGLLASLAASAAMLYGARVNLARRDF
jgi:hypothetical protein